MPGGVGGGAGNGPAYPIGVSPQPNWGVGGEQRPTEVTTVSHEGAPRPWRHELGPPKCE